MGLFISLGSFFLITFIDTLLLSVIIGIGLRKPLNEYLLWGYSPMILSGLYIGLSKARKILFVGTIVGVLFRFILWLINDILIPSPYFDHSLRPLHFGLGMLYSGLSCSLIAWITHMISDKRKQSASRAL